MTPDGLLDEIENGFWNEALSLFLVLTTKCNLRCTHCNVREWLTVADSGSAYDPKDLIDFVSRIQKGRPIYALLIGGEASLVPERMEATIQAMRRSFGSSLTLSMTTNLLNVSDEAFRSMATLDNVGVSIDGLADVHDANRGHGTFAKTYRNLAKLTKIMDPNKVSVSSCVPDHYTSEQRYSFVQAMVYAGVPRSRVSLGSFAPGVEDQNNELRKASRALLNDKPCCSYRGSSFAIVPDGHVYPGYFDIGDNARSIGTLASTADEIQMAHRQYITKYAHFLRPGSGCLTCEAFTSCWGMGCANKFKYHPQAVPSDYCDQQDTIERVRKG